MQVKRDEVWIGGIDMPLLATWDLIASGLGGLGLDLVDHWARDEKPLPFDPSKLPGYDDDWDQVVVLRVLRSQDVALPHPVKWTKQLTKPPATKPPAAKPPATKPEDEDEDDTPTTTIPEVTITADAPRPSAGIGTAVLIVALIVLAKHYLR